PASAYSTPSLHDALPICAGFARLGRELARRLLSRVIQAVGRRDYPPRRERLERAAARLSLGVSRGKSGKSQDFTLSECCLELRQDRKSTRLNSSHGSISY